MTLRLWHLSIASLLAALSLNATAAYPIAGVRPWERPAGAPVITEFKKGPEWYQRALTGISKPYPASLRFLEDQGAWYTPFNHPGMPAPYDIRGWHQRAGKGRQ